MTADHRIIMQAQVSPETVEAVCYCGQLMSSYGSTLAARFSEHVKRVRAEERETTVDTCGVEFAPWLHVRPAEGARMNAEHCPSCPFAACEGCRYQPEGDDE